MTITKLKKYKLLRELALRWRRLRASRSYSTGRGNKIKCKGIRIGTKVQIEGNGNTVEISKEAVVRDCLIKIKGNCCRVNVGKNCFISDAELWIEDNGCEITIGDNTFIGHHSHLACTESNHRIDVGADSLISSYVQIRTGDSHSILDVHGKRINEAANVTIGRHCWLGQGSRILKGTVLNHDTIIATGAIVHGHFDSNCVIAGVPGKIIKKEVSWQSDRI